MNPDIKRIVVVVCAVVAGAIFAAIGFEFVDEDVLKWIAAAGVIGMIGLGLTQL